tara:strand:- start:13 stop:171 length:159 start_codon:yes stop_codon:yes gene_type:complete
MVIFWAQTYGDSSSTKNNVGFILFIFDKLLQGSAALVLSPAVPELGEPPVRQ